MQVSRTATFEEIGKMKINDFNKPLGKGEFDKLLDKLEIDDISQEDKEVFLSILFDKKITKEEFHSLSFEQVQTLNEFTSRSDLDGSPMAGTFFMFEGLELAPYLATPNISDDSNYNKAVFNVLKELNLSQEEGISFINEVMGGTRNMEEVRDFENRLTSEQYDSGVRYKTYIGQDMQEFISDKLSKLEKGLSSSSDEVVKKEYEFYINIYTQIQNEYNTINQENKSQLEQYTRNTRANPIYNADVINLHKSVSNEYEQKEIDEFDQLLDKLNIKNLSQSEKEMFRAILEDDEFSNMEMDKLSFEEMKKISQLLSGWDKGENFEDKLSVRYGSKTAALLSTVNATDDDIFNKALFEKVKQMDDIDEINDFLTPFLNNIYEKLKEYKDIVKLDMNEILIDIIADFKEYYNKAEDNEVRKHYKEIIEVYSEFKDFYNALKEAS